VLRMVTIRTLADGTTSLLPSKRSSRLSYTHRTATELDRLNKIELPKTYVSDIVLPSGFLIADSPKQHQVRSLPQA